MLCDRINAFRRRGAFGDRILAALIVSTERVELDLVPTTAGMGEAPYVWTPTPADSRLRSKLRRDIVDLVHTDIAVAGLASRSMA